MMETINEADAMELGLVSSPTSCSALSSNITKATLLKSRPADNELRILICTACYFVLDGVTLTIRRLESHLRSKGAIVKILSTVPDDLSEEQRQDIIIVPSVKIPFTQAGTGYAFGVELGAQTIREIEKFNPNCVHFTVPDLVGLDGVRWCQHNNVPFIATWHSNYGDYLKYYYLDWVLKPGFLKYLQGFYDQMPVLYVPTPFIIEKLKDEGFDSTTELKEWGRGVDMKLFSPDRRSQAFRSSRGISENDVVILWVGRLVPEKSPEIWISVLQRLYNEGIPVKGLVVGHGAYEADLARLKNVHACGWLSGEKLAEAYASADILLFPSDVETFGNVTLEALASGCVCVVETNCGKHLVEHGHNGYTCSAHDSEAFFEATKSIVQNAQLRKTMSQHARQSAWRFERSKILQQMAENYKDAIVRHSNPSFIVERLKSSPKAAGKNILSILCCNFWLIKHLAQPLLNTIGGAQNVALSSTECVNSTRNRFIEKCLTSSSDGAIRSAELARFDDERKERKQYSVLLMYLYNAMVTCGLSCSYVLVIGLILAAFFV